MPWFVGFLLTITPGSTLSSAPSVEPSSSTSRSYRRWAGCRASVRRIFSPSLYAKVATRMRAFTLGSVTPRRLRPSAGSTHRSPPHGADDGVGSGHSPLEESHGLDVVQIVEDDAAPASDRDNLANLVRIGPADMNVGDHVVGIAQRRKDDVVAARAQCAGPDG